jgi:hypothetical protein
MEHLSIDCSTGTSTRVSLSPTEQAERVALASAAQAALQARAQLQTQVAALAQSAVGVALQDLTAAQIKAVVGCLLLKGGAIDPATLQVRPLASWMPT